MSNVSAFTDMLNQGLDDLAARLGTIVNLPVVRDSRNIIPNCVLIQAPSFVAWNPNILDVTFPLTVIGSGPGNLDSLRILLNIVSRICVGAGSVIDGRPVSVDIGGTVAPGYELNVKWQVQNA